MASLAPNTEMQFPLPRMTAVLESALGRCCDHLLSLRTEEGIWKGELSASALSTATAVVALDLFRRGISNADPILTRRIDDGLTWLANHANADGGWGDTVMSLSNISTTTLVWAALTGINAPGLDPAVVRGAQLWLSRRTGGLEAERIAEKILERYGSDRTFSAPILAHCALAGRFGAGSSAWQHVIPLPFELASLPRSWFGALGLPVVSYALPALIAIGYARHYHAPSNFFLRSVRSWLTARVFNVLESIQPANGGFLEATPLTSFVAMSLAGSGKADHPVTRRAVGFLLESAQPDGSWRIDTNLSTFLTSLATQALSFEENPLLSQESRAAVQDWLLQQQYRCHHPYTHAAPGAWAWTPLPGGVPDADDTAGALLALRALRLPDEGLTDAVKGGTSWLLDLQNRDGGIPTFCRGWGKLPFDRSSADLTAHALRAWVSWHSELPAPLQSRIARAKERAVSYLRREQETAGSWAPLWFGNQFEPDESNRVYGTSRVVLALAETGLAPDSLGKAVRWLVQVQRPDGGWNGGVGTGESSTEETALALEALCAAGQANPLPGPNLEASIRKGLEHLLSRIAEERWEVPAPIGFYFAKLWYFEKLYPVIFTVAALQRARGWAKTVGLTA